jgi:hypothetical protein
VVVVRDQDGKVASVSRAETKREADTLRRDMKSEFGQGYTVSAVIKAAEFNARRDAVGSQFLEGLFKVLDETGIGEDLQDDINQLVLSSMPDLSLGQARHPPQGHGRVLAGRAPRLRAEHVPRRALPPARALRRPAGAQAARGREVRQGPQRADREREGAAGARRGAQAPRAADEPDDRTRGPRRSPRSASSSTSACRPPRRW